MTIIFSVKKIVDNTYLFHINSNVEYSETDHIRIYKFLDVNSFNI